MEIVTREVEGPVSPLKPVRTLLYFSCYHFFFEYEQSNKARGQIRAVISVKLKNSVGEVCVVSSTR